MFCLSSEVVRRSFYLTVVYQNTKEKTYPVISIQNFILT